LDRDPTITIRPVRESDLPAYREIRLEALQAHPEAYGSDYAEQAADPESVWMGRIRASVEGTASRIFLAEDAETIVGLVAAYREKGAKVCHSATLVSVYVRPPWRGRGLAEQMIAQVLSWCASAGVRILRLTVVTSNTAAIRCYQRCGFRVCGVQPEVIRVGNQYHDELLMWRRID
jgi:ribosomal protein S18 acetylase RimI-like enzyme